MSSKPVPSLATDQRQKSALGLFSLNVFGYRRMRQYDSRRYGCPLVPNGKAGRNSMSERAQARSADERGGEFVDSDYFLQ